MSSRFLLLISLAVLSCGCGQKGSAPTVPAESPSQVVPPVSITLPEDLAQAGWTMTEIAPSELMDYNPRWAQAPSGPAIPQFKPR